MGPMVVAAPTGEDDGNPNGPHGGDSPHRAILQTPWHPGWTKEKREMLSIIQTDLKNTLGRILLMALVVFAPALVGTSGNAAAKAPEKAAGTKTFQSPEAAVQALIEALKINDDKALLAIFGKEGKELIASGDEIADRKGRTRFLELYETRHQLSTESDRMMALEVGEENWPFPIPLVREGEVWRFDTRLGREEILNRRIGRNEANAVQTCLAYVDAQREYAAKDRDGDGVLEYAQQLVSSRGRQDGLFWPAEEGRETSPLGPLFARAQEEGYGRKQGSPRCLSLPRLLLPDAEGPGETRSGRGSRLCHQGQHDGWVCPGGLPGPLWVFRDHDFHGEP